MLHEPVNETILLHSPITQAAYDYWQQVGGDFGIPTRASITPEGMIQFLPNVILLDIVLEPLDFRYRLIGTKVAQQMIYKDHTGNSMGELPHQGPGSQIFENCRQVYETGLPIGGQTPYVGQNSDYKSTEDIILPLARNGNDIDMLLVVAEFLEARI